GFAARCLARALAWLLGTVPTDPAPAVPVAPAGAAPLLWVAATTPTEPPAVAPSLPPPVPAPGPSVASGVRLPFLPPRARPCLALSLTLAAAGVDFAAGPTPIETLAPAPLRPAPVETLPLAAGVCPRRRLVVPAECLV